MFSPHRRSPKSGAMLFCFILSVLSAPAAQPLASPDVAQDSAAATSTRRLTSHVEKVAVERHAVQHGDVSPPNHPGLGQLLSDEELGQLAAKAEEPGDHIVGGALNNQQLTYIVIALAAAVVVLIAK